MPRMNEWERRGLVNIIKRANGYGADVDTDNNDEIVIRTGLVSHGGDWVPMRDGALDRDAIDAMIHARRVDAAKAAKLRARQQFGAAMLQSIDQLLNPEKWMTDAEIERAIDDGRLNEDGIREWKVDDLEEINRLVTAAVGITFTRELCETEGEGS